MSLTNLQFSDFNFVRQGDICVPAVPESIPPGACQGSTGTYLGPSGYRLKAGDACDKRLGVVLDAPIQKECSPPELPEGDVGQKIFDFSSEIVQQEYFKFSSVRNLVLFLGIR